MSGRAALVTGAGGGIGGALVERLDADGWAVHGVDVADADLATREGNRTVVEAALERFGRLDAVVANAGFQQVAPLEEFPEDEWDRLLAVLLTSPFLLARYAWPALRASGDGRFLAIASVHGLVASPFKAGYVAAKHGVLGLVKTLALEGAAHGISAAALCPAFVRTPLVEAQLAAQARAHGLPEERVLEDVILARQAVSACSSRRRWPRPPPSCSAPPGKARRAPRSCWTSAGSPTSASGIQDGRRLALDRAIRLV